MRLTERLRLEPIGPHNVDDFFAVHSDPAVAEWYPLTRDEVEQRAEAWGRAWAERGVHKWMAYSRETGELIGRGGLSYWLIDGVDEVAELGEEVLELGWAVLGEHWGKGYASEIGRAGLDYAFGELGADAVYAFTEVINKRSIAVMERIGMMFLMHTVHEGFVEGKDGVHPDAPFVIYAVRRPG